jgi:hypothetical protein
VIAALAVFGLVLVVLIVVGLLLLSSPSHYRKDTLVYDDFSEVRGGMAAAGRQMGEALTHLTWGSGSIDMWRHRCAASTQASRARRRR